MIGMSTYRDWHVGMKLVCVDASGWMNRLVPRKIYTLSAIGEAFGHIYVGLEETPNKDGNKLHWRASRFRPVQPRKTDISVFTAILKGAKEKASV